MFVLLEVQGFQYKVVIGDFLYVNYINKELGEHIVFKNILLYYRDANDFAIGNPIVKNMSVSVKVLQHIKSDKVLIFKKKRRKGYKVKNGHRQSLTKIKVLSIN
jgi:large subunit ribosomal protein L21